MRYERPLFFSVSLFHGPVSQNGVCCFRNAFRAVLASSLELISPSLFHLSIRPAFFRNFAFATPMSDGSRLPAWLTPNTNPPSPEKNGYMWYASPFVPCWTAMPNAVWWAFLNASASRSSWAQVVGTFASFVL